MRLEESYSALIKLRLALGIHRRCRRSLVLPVKEAQSQYLVERSVKVFINVFQVKITNEMKHKSCYTLTID